MKHPDFSWEIPTAKKKQISSPRGCIEHGDLRVSHIFIQRLHNLGRSKKMPIRNMAVWMMETTQSSKKIEMEKVHVSKKHVGSL